MFQMYGVNPPMCTPFQENGELDIDSLKALVSFLRDRVDGLFVCGSYGGGVLMTEEERRQVLEVTLAEVGGKIPVIAHVGTTSNIPETMCLAILTRWSRQPGTSPCMSTTIPSSKDTPWMSA